MPKEWKQKIPRKLFVHFWVWFQKRTDPKKWVEKKTESVGEFKELCKAEGTQIYSTVNETRAAFAEGTIRSLKNILYRYMEDNGYKYIHKLTQFVKTLNFRRNCSIDLMPENVKKFRLFLHSVQQTTTRIWKTEVQNWRQSSHLKKRFTLHEGLKAKVYSRGFRYCGNFFQKTSNIHIKRWTRWDYPR